MWFKSRVADSTWSKQRQLPDWAKSIFSDSMIAAGNISTEQELEESPDQAAVAESIFAKQSLKRRGVAMDLAGAFLFLASADSSFVTGQVINVDGGWVMY